MKLLLLLQLILFWRGSANQFGLELIPLQQSREILSSHCDGANKKTFIVTIIGRKLSDNLR